MSNVPSVVEFVLAVERICSELIPESLNGRSAGQFCSEQSLVGIVDVLGNNLRPRTVYIILQE
jgi:hypothetical protein